MDGGTFSAINTTFKFIEFCYKLSDVSEENRVFCRLIQRVRDDLEEAFRLMKIPAVQAQWQNDPNEKTYVEGTVQSVRQALAGIGRFVESVRIDEERNGSIGIYTRFEWVVRHQTKLTTRQLELDTSHKSLLHSIGSMKLAQHLVPVLPNYGDVAGGRNGEHDDGLDDFLNARKRRMTRMGEKQEENLIDLQVTPNNGLPALEAQTLQVLTPSGSKRLRKAASTNFEISSIFPPSWTETPDLSLEAPKVKSPQPADVDMNSAKPCVPELEYCPGTPHLPPQQSPLSQISTLSNPTNSLSPTYTESSFFPSAPPTPFFLATRPHSSYAARRQRSLSSVSTLTDVERPTTSTPSYPGYTSPRRKPVPIRTINSDVPSWQSSYSAANAPEVVHFPPALPPKVWLESQVQQSQLWEEPQQLSNEKPVYDDILPEVVTPELREMREGIYPEVVPLQPAHAQTYPGPAYPGLGQTMSATQEQRARRRARLLMITD